MKNRLDPQPVTLDVRPIELYRDEPGRAEALGAANGRDLVLERINIVAGLAAVAVALVFVLACLTGCSSLGAIGTGLQTARDVARVGCAILEGTDGSTADVLARTQELQRAILEASAETAKASGADARTIDGLVSSVVVLSRALEAASKPIVEASGNGPAKLTPCPAAPVEPKP